MKPGDTLVVEAASSTPSSALFASAATRSLGPTVRDGAIVLDEIGARRRPARRAGPTSRTAAATASRAGTTTPSSATRSAPHSWKRYLHPPAVVRWRARRENGGFVAEPETAPAAALRVRGRARRASSPRSSSRTASSSAGRSSTRPTARAARPPSCVAVHCGSPAGTCFCASMGTGPAGAARLRPRADRGRSTAAGTRFVVEVGSERGAEVAEALPHRAAPSRATSRPPRAVVARGRGRDGPRARHRRASRSCSTAATRTRAGTRWPSAASPARTARWSARPASARRSRTRPTSPGTADRAAAHLGLLLLAGVLLHPRRQRAHLRRARATGSGSRTSSRPGTTSSASRAASAAGAASPGARWASTSPRRPRAVRQGEAQGSRP